MELTGTVIKSTGSWYQILGADDKVIQGRIRGKLRLEDSDMSNPVAVGDKVVYELDLNYADTASIVTVLPRKNHIIRKSNKLSSKRQVIAANLDLAVMVASLVSPRTSLGFIDRFLVCCEAFHIPALLYFNKTDLLNENGMEVLAEIRGIYEKAGYDCMAGSALDSGSVAELRSRFEGKTIMETGHSGAGKSTLLNNLFPGANARVMAISEHHEKGKHTTTFAEMHLLPNNTRIIDTPGIRDFGVVDVPENEIGQYFPEFRKVSLSCKFNDCQHTNEPGCAVKEAVENGEISEERYYSYLSILRGEDVFQ
ncbi:MAG: ribosome small subunit-dependent GTPase A [Bacteroidetes bacterium]|nr:ribosome small subunit-dependent GTPase A [Bacteroidota bacterium]